MAKKSACICRFVLNLSDDGTPSELIYNPRCQFHKGPDAGYGYDEHGRPNTKHSELVGTIGTAIIVLAVVAAVGFLIGSAFGVFG